MFAFKTMMSPCIMLHVDGIHYKVQPFFMGANKKYNKSHYPSAKPFSSEHS